MHQIVEIIEAEVRSRPSAVEFEMAYQARIAIDRIKFAIRHTEQFSKPCIHMREAGLQLLDALERLESLDRRFQIRSGCPSNRNGDGRGKSMIDAKSTATKHNGRSSCIAARTGLRQSETPAITLNAS